MTDAMPDAGGPVLVAESGNRARQELGSALRAGGRPVIEVADVAGCLAAAGLPDLAAVVLALDLPGRLGPVALVGAVRDRCRGARLVVAVPDTDVGGGTAALAAGADDWVAKPFRPGEVEAGSSWSRARRRATGRPPARSSAGPTWSSTVTTGCCAGAGRTWPSPLTNSACWRCWPPTRADCSVTRPC